MVQCDHEEADTRIAIHIEDSLRNGARTILVRTVDTDIMVIIAGVFFKLQATYSGLDINCVAFSMGKHFQYYHINTISQNLGEPLCQALPFYYAFTGCDTMSQFLGKGKKSAWEAWKSLPNVTDAFQFIAQHPFHVLELSSATFQLLEHFACILYDRTTSITKVNELRQELLSKRSKSMESIPPTQVKLRNLCIECHVTVVLKKFFFY